MSKIIRIFLNFFFIEEYPFRSTFFVIDIFLITSIFKSLYFLKWCPIFDTSPLTQFWKFNNFLWVCWFLAKNLSNFLPTIWKLHNLYCYSMYVSFYVIILNFSRCIFFKFYFLSGPGDLGWQESLVGSDAMLANFWKFNIYGRFERSRQPRRSRKPRRSGSLRRSRMPRLDQKVREVEEF